MTVMESSEVTAHPSTKGFQGIKANDQDELPPSASSRTSARVLPRTAELYKGR